MYNECFTCSGHMNGNKYRDPLGINIQYSVAMFTHFKPAIVEINEPKSILICHTEVEDHQDHFLNEGRICHGSGDKSQRATKTGSS